MLDYRGSRFTADVVPTLLAGALALLPAPSIAEQTAPPGTGGPKAPADSQAAAETEQAALHTAHVVSGIDFSVEALRNLPKVGEFVREAYAHKKAIGASSEGGDYLKAAGVVVTANGAEAEVGIEVA